MELFSVTIYFMREPLRQGYPKERCIVTRLVRAEHFQEAIDKLELSPNDVERVEISVIYGDLIK